MINDQDRKVAELLKTWDIKSSATYEGLNTKNGWEHFTWSIGFNGETFYYNAGIGHVLKGYRTNKSIRELWTYPSGTGERFNNQLIEHPTQASVLYCLLLDADASDHNLFDWCDMYGYNPDSKKDSKLYEDCLNIGIQLRKVFSYSQLEELREVLEDY